ncbi:hypothetical protein D3C77_357990 [compost metagenome]
MHQIEHLYGSVKTRCCRAGLQIENVAQMQFLGVIGAGGNLAQVGHDFNGGAALLQYLDGGLDQFARAGVCPQQLLIIARVHADTDSQLVQVTEQVNLGIGYAFPAQEVELDVATKRIDQCVEQGRLAGIDCRQCAANAQHGLGRPGGGGDRAGAQDRGVRYLVAVDQGPHTCGNTGGDLSRGNHPDGFVACGIDTEAAQAVGSGLQSTAGGCKGMRGTLREAVANGRGTRQGIGAWAHARADRSLTRRFQRGHVGYPLQASLLQIQSAAIDHHQHE